MDCNCNCIDVQTVLPSTVMALLFTGRYFREFHKNVALRKNIIVNTYERDALLQCYILAS